MDSRYMFVLILADFRRSFTSLVYVLSFKICTKFLCTWIIIHPLPLSQIHVRQFDGVVLSKFHSLKSFYGQNYFYHSLPCFECFFANFDEHVRNTKAFFYFDPSHSVRHYRTPNHHLTYIRQFQFVLCQHHF